MFIGHLAVGFAAKRAAPKTSLAALLAATVWCDYLFTAFLWTGIETASIDKTPGRFMPINLPDLYWSHSLVMTALWGILLGGGYYLLRRYKAGAIWIAVCVLSHWVLDWIAHRPDMALYPGGARYGLGLWDHPAATAIIEGGMFAAAVWIYGRATTARDGVGRWAFYAFVGTLAALYAMTFFGPLPPNMRVVAISNTVMLAILPVWAGWVDRTP